MSPEAADGHFQFCSVELRLDTLELFDSTACFIIALRGKRASKLRERTAQKEKEEELRKKAFFFPRNFRFLTAKFFTFSLQVFFLCLSRFVLNKDFPPGISLPRTSHPVIFPSFFNRFFLRFLNFIEEILSLVFPIRKKRALKIISLLCL